MEDVDFADMIGRAKAGDHASISGILGRFEAEVRAMVRGETVQARYRLGRRIKCRSFEEIAARLGIGERSVRRVTKAIESRMETRQ